ncbi:FliM/FliN family flagellar motor C-terminal domain-containing protein [Phaeobacter sp.]|uniref:FliM/FliN family flagellar motor C-terminal domain-containing protein n=1 Tax=Phaeobacter sp. TaxID=1902409 RepID=UPI0025DBE6BE|nr:FliM/FliN family flagellar motor C-terminal domain-containing protein [Phaeobacter sp.]
MAEEETETEAAGSRGGVARKLAATKEGKSALSSSLTLKALRRSIARAAADLCDLPAAVLAARQANRVPEDLAANLSDSDLLILLDGPEGRIGAATLDAAAVTALIQQQTMGLVLGKAPSERNYTPTDAAMVADFLERVFAKVVSMLAGQADEAIFSGYRFGAQIENVRSLVLGMEAEDYRVIDLTLDLSCGAMQGTLKLVLPEPAPEEKDLSGANGQVGPSLGSNMGAMRAELRAVLCKMQVPANTFSDLKEGDILPLDQAFLYETEMISITGQSIAQGRLGQMNGARAVRLTDPNALASETGNDGSFVSQMGGGEPAAMDLAPPMDLSIAAQGLQDPMQDMGGDLGSLGADFDAEFGADLGADLGGDLGGGLGAPLGGDLGGLPAADGLPDLPAMGDLGGDLGADLGADFGGTLDTGLPADLPDLGATPAEAEIAELAGLSNNS